MRFIVLGLHTYWQTYILCICHTPTAHVSRSGWKFYDNWTICTRPTL